MAEKLAQGCAASISQEIQGVRENLASCLSLDDFQGAIRNLKRICLVDCLDVENFRNLGLLYQFCGRLDCALRALLCGLAIDETHASSHYTLSKQIKYKKYPRIANSLEKANIYSYPNNQDRIKICFAKSNLYHQIGDYDASSFWLVRGNQLRLLDNESDLNQIKAVGEFRRVLASNCAADVCGSRFEAGQGLIFLVGLPRCGSTLLDAVLCRSDEVDDLGECEEFEKALAATMQLGWDENSIKILGEKYLNGVKGCCNGRYLVDKSLFNFINVGLITRCFPLAKIIHCSRNPFAHALSLYRANIFPGSSFSSDLEDIAEMIIYERRVMCDFTQLFPDRILALKYEKLVISPASVLRDVVGWIGLPWSESFLRHHESRQLTQTASRVQVRRPINSHSLELWRHYSTMLRPMSARLYGALDLPDLF